jgi:hypothetical protein
MRYDFPPFINKIKTADCQKSFFLPQRTQREKDKRAKIKENSCRPLCGKK